MGQVHPPVIIVHGFLSSHHMMRPLKWALERRGRSVFLTPSLAFLYSRCHPIGWTA